MGISWELVTHRDFIEWSFCFLLLKSGALGLDNIRDNFDLEFNEEDHSKQKITHEKMDEKVIWEN